MESRKLNPKWCSLRRRNQLTASRKVPHLLVQYLCIKWPCLTHTWHFLTEDTTSDSFVLHWMRGTDLEWDDTILWWYDLSGIIVIIVGLKSTKKRWRQDIMIERNLNYHKVINNKFGISYFCPCTIFPLMIICIISVLFFTTSFCLVQKNS